MQLQKFQLKAKCKYIHNYIAVSSVSWLELLLLGMGDTTTRKKQTDGGGGDKKKSPQCDLISCLPQMTWYSDMFPVTASIS